MPLTAEELKRYSRHLSLLEVGTAGQERLAAARVLVIGAGGLGSPALLYLAAADVGTPGIVDHDWVDLSNLQRQVLFASDDVGQPKASAARARLLVLNPSLTAEVRRFRELGFERRADCPVCGEHATIRTLQDVAPVCGATLGIRAIEPVELKMWIESCEPGSQLLLVDVREPHEFEAGHLVSALNVPLGSLPQRLPEFSPQQALVFMCRGGGRSLQACRLALAHGFDDVANLEGGLVRWTRDLDANLTVV